MVEMMLGVCMLFGGYQRCLPRERVVGLKRKEGKKREFGENI